jgi:NADPH-ferrihemoprotein reductase
VAVTVAVLRYTNSKNRVHDGVCTTWLASQPVGAPVPLFVRTSNFRLPPDAATPVIMVGPGTGLAPFRGFIQARALANVPAAKTVLFFGCRHPEHDFLYRDELEQHVANGHLTLVTAFSREHTSKCYVQHRISERAVETAALLKSNAWVYVCGDARRMPAEVREALVQVLVNHGGMGAQAADELLARMQKEGRYQLDVWF